MWLRRGSRAERTVPWPPADQAVQLRRERLRPLLISNNHDKYNTITINTNMFIVTAATGAPAAIIVITSFLLV